MTISEAMVLQKVVRERVSDLRSLRNSNAVRTRTFSYLGDGEPKERIETELQYDPKVIDRKVSELNTFLFKIDAAIKQANAKTEIALSADVDKLLEPIQ